MRQKGQISSGSLSHRFPSNCRGSGTPRKATGYASRVEKDKSTYLEALVSRQLSPCLLGNSMAKTRRISMGTLFPSPSVILRQSLADIRGKGECVALGQPNGRKGLVKTSEVKFASHRRPNKRIPAPERTNGGGAGTDHIAVELRDGRGLRSLC